VLVWLSGLLLALFLLVIIADAWLGWRWAKTEQQKLYWWLGIITLLVLALTLTLDVGFGLRL